MNDVMNEPPATASDAPSDPGADSRNFAEEAEGAAPSLAREFFDFLLDNKKWWLGPIVVTLLLVSFLLIAGGSAAPFIYALF